MNYAFLLVFSFFTYAVNSCSSVYVEKNNINMQALMKENDSFSFSEVRRLNHKIQLPEYSLLTTFDQTLNLYSQLEDKRYSRSEPIPALFDNEFFLVLKPKLEKQQYGDIEVTKLQTNDSVLNVYYKEISNSEYSLNKQNNPILILRVNGKLPSKVNLIHQNKY